MVSSSQRRTSRSQSVDEPVGIPMKGVSPKWYAIGGVALLAAIGLAVALSGDKKKHEAVVAPVQTAAAGVDPREQAAEQRRHLEITQRSLERLEAAQQNKAAAPEANQNATEGATPAATRPVGARAPAAAAAPAPAPAPPPKAPKKQLDTLDSIGSDITKQLGE